MKRIKKLILWSLVLIWMVNILTFSSKPADISKQQSGFFVSIVQRIVNHLESSLKIPPTNTDKLDYFIRKTAHVFNYFILTILLIYAYLGINLSTKRNFLHSLQSSFLFSILDELLQTFVPGRSGMFRDVLIDQIGTFLALLLIFLIYKRTLFTKQVKL